jgi:hypothetical protein
MAFEIRKISNYGTQNPVVARLKVQTQELIQWPAPGLVDTLLS